VPLAPGDVESCGSGCVDGRGHHPLDPAAGAGSPVPGDRGWRARVARWQVDGAGVGETPARGFRDPRGHVETRSARGGHQRCRHRRRGERAPAHDQPGAWRLPLAQLPLPGSPAHAVSPQRLAGEQRATSVNGQRCCNGGASARSAIDGDVIWYSTTDGIVGVDTRALGALPTAPPATVVAVEHDGKSFFGSSFELDQGTRDLTVHYTAPYLRIGTMRFRYQLEGYDTGWQNADVRREAFYTHLPAGNYRFRVAATLPGATGYGAEASVVIRITPRWYERVVVRA